MTTPLLAVDELEVRHGAVTAVRGLTLEVAAGEIVGLIGPNGAGKSSTLHAIMGLVRASGGDVRLDGVSIVGRSPEHVARRGIAIVPEGRRIFAELTVDENLQLGLSGRRERGDLDADLEQVYELFPIVRESRKRQAGALSGGQQQQLAIARALVADPRVLLLDEPSLGLAPLMVERIFATIAELKRQGRTILLVEQNVHQALDVADRAYVLETGRITLDGESAVLRHDPKVEQSYLGVGGVAL
jgi:branched-chain amino acid transport system ATP-binding protein